MQSSGLGALVRLVIARDLRLAVRHWDQVIQPLIFFAIITTLFPLAISPALDELRRIAPGVVWVAAMLASLLALESLFRPDVEDGTMEQWVLSGQPLSLLLLAKVVTHWLLTGLPLVLMSPLVGTALGMPQSVWPVLMATLALGTGSLSMLGADRGGADGQRAAGQRAAGSAGAAAGNARTDFRCAGRGSGHAGRSGRRSAKLARRGAAVLRQPGAVRDGGGNARQRRVLKVRTKVSRAHSLYMWLWFHKLSSPPYAYRLATLLRPWFFWTALALMLFAAYGGLVLAPPDYQQKDAFRIIYVHAPAAIMSLQVYVVMAIAAAVGVIWRIKLAHAVAAACAPVGAAFTVVALATGSIYGKPMWGTWWEWDPRITTELIQLFLYLGYMALRASFDDTQRADRASAILAIVGVVNVPIVKYSVVWWNSLHQAPTISKIGKPSIELSMAWPLYTMLLGFMLYFAAVLCDRVRSEILRRERNAAWLLETVKTS